MSLRNIEVESVNKMDYIQWHKYYTQNYVNYYSRRMKSLDFKNVDLDNLALIKGMDPRKVPNRQVELLERFMRANRRTQNRESIPYLTYALVNTKKSNSDGLPLTRVGYTQDLIKRKKAYNAEARKGAKWGSVYDDIRNQGIDDFEFILLDLQLGRINARKSEEFFTCYFNRDSTALESQWAPDGVNLKKNDLYNPVIGDLFGKTGKAHPLYKEVFSLDVKEAIEKGFQKADIAIKLGVTIETLSNRLMSWGFQYDSWAQEIRKRKLIEYFSQGLQFDEIVKKFAHFDLKNKMNIARNAKLIATIQVDKLNLIPYTDKAVRGWTRQQLGCSPSDAYERFYVKPIVLSLANLPLTTSQVLEILEAMGVTNPKAKVKGAPYKLYSLNDMLKDRLWGAGQGIPWSGRGKLKHNLIDVSLEPIIENLIRYKDNNGKRLSEDTIGILLGYTSGFVSRYLKRRWGFNSIVQARNFFDTHYLGHHVYDYYHLN